MKTAITENKSTIVLNNVNASWPKLDKPDGIEGTPTDQLKYSIQALLRINDDTFAAFKKRVAARLPKGFGKPSADKLPWKEQNEKLPDAWGDASAYRITFKHKSQPKTYDAKGLPCAPEVIKAGDLVNIAFTVWPVENKFGAFIQLQLAAVMKVADDLDFGGNGPSVDASVFGVAPVSFNELDASVPSTDDFDSEIPF